MSDRRTFLTELATLGAGVPALSLAQGGLTPARAGAPADDRAYWVSVVKRLADPVLGALARGQLKALMPVEIAPGGNVAGRRDVTHLEAVGRLLCGIAPWLELGADGTPEGEMRASYASLARRGIAAATDPQSPDFLNFTRGGQPLVDAAFLAHAVVRAPRELWEKLDDRAKRNLVDALRSTRVIQPGFNNWLLFSAMVEAGLKTMGAADWDRMRIDYAVRQHEQWYKGDGVYGDGPPFHWDYYNSFVIQPMLLDVLRVTPEVTQWRAIAAEVPKRARRYAAIQERLISPEGTFPPIGRSLAYRFGAFQLLGQMALRRELPEGVAPSQVRAALTTVIRRMIEAPGTFDAKGWLTIGFCGHQPEVGETYISTGSVYLCAAGLLPLGLPATDEFWTAPATDWTQKQAWSGQRLPADHAL
jgi:hypothetical protein